MVISSIAFGTSAVESPGDAHTSRTCQAYALQHRPHTWTNPATHCLEEAPSSEQQAPAQQLFPSTGAGRPQRLSNLPQRHLSRRQTQA
jgi:hypothetical protein